MSYVITIMYSIFFSRSLSRPFASINVAIVHKHSAWWVNRGFFQVKFVSYSEKTHSISKKNQTETMIYIIYNVYMWIFEEVREKEIKIECDRWFNNVFHSSCWCWYNCYVFRPRSPQDALDTVSELWWKNYFFI